MHRKKFTLYYCKLEKGIDIEYIKDNYSVKDINPNGVLFVDKGHSHDFDVWNLLQGYNSLYEIEVKLFYKQKFNQQWGVFKISGDGLF